MFLIPTKPMAKPNEARLSIREEPKSAKTCMLPSTLRQGTKLKSKNHKKKFQGIKEELVESATFTIGFRV
jgi:hypothetical protein